MDLFADIREVILTALEGQGDAALHDQITVEPPRDPAHGEMTTNAAMVLARPLGRPAREIAQALADDLRGDARITEAIVAGPGFVNLTLTPESWQAVIDTALRATDDFGAKNLGQGRRVNVEFVSANPTGRLQLAHLRGAVFGDALARLLERTGHAVTREYYVNDAGPQMDVLARTVHLHYLRASGRAVDPEQIATPGSTAQALGEDLKATIGADLLEADEPTWLPQVRRFALTRMLEVIREDLARIGITMDVFTPESALREAGRIDTALKELDDRGLIYEGALEPAGEAPEGWTPRQQTLFRATAFGDDADRPVRQADGSWAYFAPDIAYHYDKLQRGFDSLINVMGADHGAYVKRMQAAVAALSDDKVPLTIRLVQLTRLARDGTPLSASGPEGRHMPLAALVEELGADGLRFAMLSQRGDAVLDLDLARARAQTRDNPHFWVQYALAHATDVAGRGDPAAITAAEDLALARKLAEWPAVLTLAAERAEPPRLVFYLTDLASAFDTLRQGQPLERSPAKIALARTTGIVIAAGLDILGVKAVPEMR